MKTTKSVLSLVLALVMCLGLAVPALAADASGLDGSAAEAFYKQLITYNGRGLDVLYAGLRDMDADGVSEMIVVSSEKPDRNSSSYGSATVDIWQIKNGTAMKVTSAEYGASQSCQMGYITHGGKTYILVNSFSMHQGSFGGTDVLINAGGFTEALAKYGYNGSDPAMGPAQYDYTRTLNGKTSAITEKEYIQYLSAYAGAENVYMDPETDTGPGANYPAEFFLGGGGLSWIPDKEGLASYQTVLNRLLAAKNAAPSASVPTGSYGPYQITGDDYVLSFDAAKVEKKPVMIQRVDIEGYAEPYQSETVTLVKLRPGSNIAVSGGLEPPEYYGDGRPCAIAWPGEMVDSSHFILGDVGGIVAVFIAGPVEDTFQSPGEMFYRSSSGPNSDTYFIFLDTESAAASAPTGFTDVAAGDYFASPVAWAVEKGITSGTGDNQFSPNQNCTNAQILTFLWRAYGKPEPSIRDPFANSIPEAYRKAAIWAYEKGMVSGSAFDANSPCTRAMAVKYMWQAAGSPAPARTAAFTDVPAGAAFASAVSWAVEQGITSGTSGTTFSPNDICTRGQIVTFLHRNLA